MEPERGRECADVPPFVYHGSDAAGIDCFEPRTRYVPGGADVPPRVYASINPAFAAAHSFPWSSDEGIDIRVTGSSITLCVPREHAARLHQPVYIYKLHGDSFVQTAEEQTGETVHTEHSVRPVEIAQFATVIAALEHYGGAVEVI